MKTIGNRYESKTSEDIDCYELVYKDRQTGNNRTIFVPKASSTIDEGNNLIYVDVEHLVDDFSAHP